MTSSSSSSRHRERRSRRRGGKMTSKSLLRLMHRHKTLGMALGIGITTLIAAYMAIHLAD